MPHTVRRIKGTIYRYLKIPKLIGSLSIEMEEARNDFYNLRSFTRGGIVTFSNSELNQRSMSPESATIILISIENAYKKRIDNLTQRYNQAFDHLSQAELNHLKRCVKRPILTQHEKDVYNYIKRQERIKDKNDPSRIDKKRSCYKYLI